MAGAGALEVVRSEDFVEYLLFPKETETKASSHDSTDTLTSLCNVVRCIVAENSNGYLWHRDPFNITTKDNDTEIVKDSGIYVVLELLEFKAAKRRLSFILQRTFQPG